MQGGPASGALSRWWTSTHHQPLRLLTMAARRQPARCHASLSCRSVTDVHITGLLWRGSALSANDAGAAAGIWSERRWSRCRRRSAMTPQQRRRTSSGATPPIVQSCTRYTRCSFFCIPPWCDGAAASTTPSTTPSARSVTHSLCPPSVPLGALCNFHVDVFLAQAAVRAYTSSLEGRTDDARVWANRSAAHLAAGTPAAALEDARIARTLDPAYAKVRIFRRAIWQQPEAALSRHVRCALDWHWHLRVMEALCFRLGRGRLFCRRGTGRGQRRRPCSSGSRRRRPTSRRSAWSRMPRTSARSDMSWPPAATNAAAAFVVSWHALLAWNRSCDKGRWSCVDHFTGFPASGRTRAAGSRSRGPCASPVICAAPFAEWRCLVQSPAGRLHTSVLLHQTGEARSGVHDVL